MLVALLATLADDIPFTWFEIGGQHIYLAVFLLWFLFLRSGMVHLTVRPQCGVLETHLDGKYEPTCVPAQEGIDALFAMMVPLIILFLRSEQTDLALTGSNLIRLRRDKSVDLSWENFDVYDKYALAADLCHLHQPAALSLFFWALNNESRLHKIKHCTSRSLSTGPKNNMIGTLGFDWNARKRWNGEVPPVVARMWRNLLCFRIVVVYFSRLKEISTKNLQKWQMHT